MDKLIIKGGRPLKGTVSVSGAKNVAMKVILTSLLTQDEIIVKNVPLISSVLGTTKIVQPLGVKVLRKDHELHISSAKSSKYKVPLELGDQYRTATMVMGPLLARFGRAIVPNPGGCRLGKRPVGWHIGGLEKMGARIDYRDGYFYAEAEELRGAKIRFKKNTHTGTESMILAAVLARGETVLENAAEEPEVDDLISMLSKMGAEIERKKRTITIQGKKSLRGTSHTIMPDRNEVVTYAIAAIATKGDVVVDGTQQEHLVSFLKALDDVGAGWETVNKTKTRFFWKEGLKKSDIVTGPHPEFMTDWQQPWAVLSTQANGTSTIHERVFESRFSYVEELKKMGAKIEFFKPDVVNPQEFYNFNWEDKTNTQTQAIKIFGPTKLHEGVLDVTDIRAGATLVVAALSASGTSVLKELNHLDRGYEQLETRLQTLGADVRRVTEEI